MARKKTPVASPVPTLPSNIRPPAPLAGVRLPPFSGDKHSCTKCGNSGAKTLYLNTGQTCTHCYNEGFRSLWGMERLHRVCERCGFSWDEACVQPAQEVKETLLMPVVPTTRKERRYG